MSSTGVHPLLELYLAAANGRFPAVDGSVHVVPALTAGLEASIGFTGHAIIATALAPAAVHARGVDAFGGTLAPAFLCWLAGDAGQLGSLDVTLVARGRGTGRLPRKHDLDQHPRVRLARGQRQNVEVYGDERGLVTLASGLAGRRELSIEVASDAQGRGLGRALLRDALGLVPAGEPVFAAVAAGNARSLRAFLSLGFQALGCEVVIHPARGAS
ncbi:MAG TPA: GNAT family N-acetyltransferase [Polyangiaceae bacterium]|nr:GNAT family N-acetyltransferase [Polyangiaceae bacterium]